MNAPSLAARLGHAVDEIGTGGLDALVVGPSPDMRYLVRESSPGPVSAVVWTVDPSPPHG